MDEHIMHGFALALPTIRSKVSRMIRMGGVSGFQDAGNDPPVSKSGHFPGEPCPVCECGLYRMMAGEPACIRCFPKNGSADLANKLYPRKQQKAKFGKGGEASWLQCPSLAGYSCNLSAPA